MRVSAISLAGHVLAGNANSLSPNCFAKEHASLASSARCANLSDKPSFDLLSSCIRGTPSGSAAAVYMENCLVTAGCSSEDAASEARDILDMCAVIDTELRRRSPGLLDDLGLGGDDDTGSGSSSSSSGNTKPQPAANNNANAADDQDTTTAQAKQTPTAKKDTTTAKAATTTAKKETTAAPTTTAAAATTSTDPTTSDTPTQTTTVPTTIPTVAEAVTTGSSTGPLICMTTTTVSTTHCTTSLANNHFSSTCYPTVVSFATCAAGLRCSLDQAGSPVCMRTQNELGTSGIIVALAFASAIAVAAALMVFFACKERRRNRRWAKAAEAAEIARIQRKVPGGVGGRSSTNVAVRNVSGQRGSDEDRQPLVQGAQGVQYMPPPPVPQDPFTDHQYHVR